MSLGRGAVLIERGQLAPIPATILPAVIRFLPLQTLHPFVTISQNKPLPP